VTAFPVRVHWMKRAPFEAMARKPRCDEAEGVCVGFVASDSFADGVLPPPPQPASTSVAATPHTSKLTPTREVKIVTLLSIVGLPGAGNGRTGTAGYPFAWEETEAAADIVDRNGRATNPAASL